MELENAEKAIVKPEQEPDDGHDKLTKSAVIKSSPVPRKKAKLSRDGKEHTKKSKSSKHRRSSGEKKRLIENYKYKRYDGEKHKHRKSNDGNKTGRRYGETRYTKTEPILSYRCNYLGPKLNKKSKSKSKRRTKNSSKKSAKSPSKKPSKTSSKRRSKSPSTLLEQKNTASTKEKSEKSKKVKVKKEKRKSYIEANKLSFPPEELVNENDFVLVKDTITIKETKNKPLTDELVITTDVSKKISEAIVPPTIDDTNVKNDEKIKKIKNSQSQDDKNDESPDTDDYMANWEDEDFTLNTSDKEKQPEKLQRKVAQCDDSVTMKMDIDNDRKESLEDGLGTPIFKNPSPPPDYSLINLDAEKSNTLFDNNVKQKHDKEKLFDEENNAEKPLRIPKKPLFGIEDIYQQFMESVKGTSGLDHSKKSLKNMTTSYIADLPSPLKKLPSSSSSTDSDDSESSSTSSSTSSSSSSSSTSSTSSSSKSSSSKEKRKAANKNSTIDNGTTLRQNEESLSQETINDLRILETLQKSHNIVMKMEKNDTIGENDEESKCLNEIEKYIQATKRHLLELEPIKKFDSEADKHTIQIKSEFNVTTLLSEKDIKKEIMESSEEDNDTESDTEIDINTQAGNINTNENIAMNVTSEISPERNNSEILNANRETIKITISPHGKKQAKSKDSESEDVDFTEKLLKTGKSDENDDKSLNKTSSLSPSRSDMLSPSRKNQSPTHRNNSPSRRSVSPKEKRARSLSPSPGRKERRSMSISPIRKKRKSYVSRWNKRQYSPSPPRRSRHDSPSSRRHNDSYRQRRRSVSPQKRRSRSPYYGRRYSRSPPYRPPSPAERSPCRSSKERHSSISPQLHNASMYGSSVQNSSTNVSMDQAMQYSQHNYYYLPHNQMTSEQNNHLHQQYSDFYSNYDYTTCSTEYINSGMPDNYANYTNEYNNINESAPYSQIPVIGMPSSSYYYNEFDNTHSNYHSNRSHVNIPTNNINEIIQHDNVTGKSSTVAVQKGNVLEIVPASIVSEPKKKETNTQTEQTEDQTIDGTIIKQEVDKDDEAAKRDEKMKKREHKKKQRLLKDHIRSSFQEEISRRLSICTVNRINKEGDSLRSILVNQINSPASVEKEKKKVLFADGIPPGQSSSASDDENIQKKILKKRLKKKRRKEENKENKDRPKLLDETNEIKIDPELDNMPPPPPPPGSPPRRLPQPALKKSPSPERLVYFHYDIVVDSMYISTNPIPVPPRLQSQNGTTPMPSANMASRHHGPTKSAGTPPTNPGTNGNKANFPNVTKTPSNSPNSTSNKKKTILDQKDNTSLPSHPSPSQTNSNQGNVTPVGSPNISSPIVKFNTNYSPMNKSNPTVFSHPPPFKQISGNITQIQPLPSIPQKTNPQVITSGGLNRGPVPVRGPIPSPIPGSGLVRNVGPMHAPGAIQGSASMHGPVPTYGSGPIHGPATMHGPVPMHGPTSAHGPVPMHGPAQIRGPGPGQGPGTTYILKGSSPMPSPTQGSGIAPCHAPGQIHVHLPLPGSCPVHGPGPCGNLVHLAGHSHGPPVRGPIIIRGGPSPSQSPGPGHSPSPGQSPGPGHCSSPSPIGQMPGPNMIFHRPRYSPRMLEPSMVRNTFPLPPPNSPLQYPVRYNDSSNMKYPDHFSPINYDPTVPPPFAANRMPKRTFSPRTPQNFHPDKRHPNFNPDKRPQNFPG